MLCSSSSYESARTIILWTEWCFCYYVHYQLIRIWSHMCSCSPQGSASPCAEAVSMFWHTTVTLFRANMEQKGKVDWWPSCLLFPGCFINVADSFIYFSLALICTTTGQHDSTPSIRNPTITHTHRASSCITLWWLLKYWNSLNTWCGWTPNDLILNIRHRLQKRESHMEQLLCLKVYGYSASKDIFCFYWIHKPITIVKKARRYTWPQADESVYTLPYNFSRRNFNIILMSSKWCLTLRFSS